jgi:hypothetical protein
MRALSATARYFFITVILMAAAATASAQGTAITGTIFDESKAVLPGVTVTAAQQGTGRQFTDVTNERGEYRLVGLPASRFDVRVELPGFATIVTKDVELLVGQSAALSLTMKPASVNETVTVSGAAPLIDTQQAQSAGNVDTRQMEEMPIAGRNWQQLATLVPGITMNTTGNQPGVNQDAAFQLNLDGQNITNNASNSNFGEPIINRDAIAQYQIITNNFDITLGNSLGIQVQAITKSGANTVSGSLYSYFRDSSFNAANAYTHTVLPYQDQQVGGTIGGPIIQNKLHYFLSYEGERSPNTLVLVPSALAGEQFQLPTENDQRKPLGRIDYTMSQNDHLSVRSGYSRSFTTDSDTSVPSAGISQLYDSNYTTANWAHVSSPTLLHELKVSDFHYHWDYFAAAGVPVTPTYSFPGLSLGTASNYPQNWFEDFVTTNYNMTWNKGAHNFKIGAQLRLGHDSGDWQKGERGTMAFSKLPSNAAALFPASSALDPAAWQQSLAGLNSLATTFTINYYHNNNFNIPRPSIGAWIGDTWNVGSKLTLNLGVRYDGAWDDFVSPGVTPTDLLITTGDPALGTQNFGYSNNIRDLNNVAPRGGFVWKPRGDSSTFIIHGGSGLYYSSMSEQPVDQQLYNAQNVIGNTYTNTGQPNFVLNPTGGVTAAQVLAGQVPYQPQSIVVIARDMQMPYTWQNMLGFEKQLSDLMGITADLVESTGYHLDSQRDPNLFYDPTTGLPENPNTNGRPNPLFGSIHLDDSQGRSNYMALQTSFTRRYHKNFQLGLTYTLQFYKHDTGIGSAGFGAMQTNTFNIMADWANSTNFQRNTLRANAIWMLPHALQLSAYFGYGSPNSSYTTSTNVDPLGISSTRVRSNLTVISRDNFYGNNFQTLDLHLSKDIRIGGMKLSGIAEVFNAYNHAQYTYNLLETSTAFGSPNGQANQPRTGQLAVRASF